jgi:hypothetical protein
MPDKIESNGKAPDGFALYRLTDLKRDFHEDFNPYIFWFSNYEPILEDMVQRVLEIEGPILFEDLVARICNAHGFKEFGDSTRERIANAFDPRKHTDGILGWNKFIWPADKFISRIVEPRLPATDRDIRLPDQIAMEELIAIANKCTSDDKLHQLAGYLGIEEIGTKDEDRLAEALSITSRRHTHVEHGPLVKAASFQSKILSSQDTDAEERVGATANQTDLADDEKCDDEIVYTGRGQGNEIGMIQTAAKYVGAVIVFLVAYVICSAITHIAMWVTSYDERGYWNDILPYIIAPIAGYFAVRGGLSAVDRLFPNVRVRTVAWVFIGFLCLMWGYPLLGMFLGRLIDFVGLMDLPLQSHALWSADTPPMIIQSLTAAITAWKLTADDNGKR